MERTGTERAKELIVIAGPTATGKSGAAAALACRIGGSVISADSMQVYRGMDIGSAKITQDEMRGIPHYLVDCIGPKDPWNVFLFRERAFEAVRKIDAAGRIPILCGGTGFYIQSVVYDIDFTQTETDAALREKLMRMAAEGRTAQLHRMLEEADPAAAAQIHPNNIKRVIRALEFNAQTGERISAHNENERKKSPARRTAFFVLTLDRQRLYARIDARVDAMLSAGLVDEVRDLQKEGLTTADISMQGLGYKEILEYLDGKSTLEEAVTRIKTGTRHFAKRQLTWFRRERDAVWVDVQPYEGDPDALAAHLEVLYEDLLHGDAVKTKEDE